MATVYEIVTDEILKRLDQGVVPWRRPWYCPTARNWKTQKPYRGINAMLLQGGEYLTYKQALEAGGRVKRGEHGHPIFFFSWIEKENIKTGKSERHAILRYYTGFEISQCEGIASKFEEAEPLQFSPIEAAEKLICGYGHAPEIRHCEPSAFYSPAGDYINMPQKATFVNEEEYYSTLFHEAVHSTGHVSRLNRKGIVSTAHFGSKNYGQEELVAEMGAAMLCGVAHIEHATIDNSAAYIQSWKKAIAADIKMVMMAAAQAQKAADYIQGIRIN